jgi:hypothetical protein
MSSPLSQSQRSAGRLDPLLMVWSFMALTSLTIYGVLLWPALPRIGADFKAFYTASQLIAAGGNPYNLNELRAMQNVVLNAGLSPGSPSFYPLDPVANPPLFYWLLRPLTLLPPSSAFVVWTLLALLMTVVAVGLATRRLGRVAPGYLLLGPLWLIALPQSMVNLIMGQPDALFLLGLVGALLCLERERPAWAGLILGIGWVKPHVLLPIACALLLVERSWRGVGGLVLGSALGAAASMMWCGPASVAWLHYLMVDRGTGLLFSAQPTLPSLLSSALGPLANPLGLAAFALVVGLLAANHSTFSDLWTRAGVIVCAWLVLAPYLHLNDDLLIAVPLLLLLITPRMPARGLLLGLAVVGLYSLPPSNLWLGTAPALDVLPLGLFGALLWWTARQDSAPVWARATPPIVRAAPSRAGERPEAASEGQFQAPPPLPR